MKSLLIGIFLSVITINAHAFNWPWQDQTEEMYNSVSETLASRGDTQNKVVTYHVRDISKRAINKEYKPREESLSSEVLAYLQDSLGGLKAEAQIYSDVYLGFDNKKFKKDSVTVEGNIIKVKLPEIEIISTDIDFNDSVLITKESGILTSNKERDELINSLYNEHKKEILENIIKEEKNIHEARLNAQQIMREAIMKNHSSEYTIEFIK